MGFDASFSVGDIHANLTIFDKTPLSCRKLVRCADTTQNRTCYVDRTLNRDVLIFAQKQCVCLAGK